MTSDNIYQEPNQYFSGDNVGVIPRALEDIFALSADGGNPPDIAVSFVEIYNEKVYDLLAEDTNEQVNIKGKFQFKIALGRHIEWSLLVNEIASTASINILPENLFCTFGA